ncbi:hypothetical protein [Vibrio rotiferianus]|uniref:hypothetical protein n=1 Tax=Vibrio rotiferianus TaxID=190895 RepID=UPI001E5F5E10|nr:hypothetical protein [Vibrio rotiferianus]
MKTQDLSEFASGMEYDAQYDKHYEDDIALIQKHITAMGARSLLWYGYCHHTCREEAR